MSKNICPKCAQVTLSFGSEEEIQCPICATTFSSNEDSDDAEPDNNK